MLIYQRVHLPLDFAMLGMIHILVKLSPFHHRAWRTHLAAHSSVDQQYLLLQREFLLSSFSSLMVVNGNSCPRPHHHHHHHHQISKHRQVARRMERVHSSTCEIPLPTGGHKTHDVILTFVPTETDEIAMYIAMSETTKIEDNTYIYTIWLFNIAMENHHF